MHTAQRDTSEKRVDRPLTDMHAAHFDWFVFHGFQWFLQYSSCLLLSLRSFLDLTESWGEQKTHLCELHLIYKFESELRGWIGGTTPVNNPNYLTSWIEKNPTHLNGVKFCILHQFKKQSNHKAYQENHVLFSLLCLYWIIPDILNKDCRLNVIYGNGQAVKSLLLRFRAFSFLKKNRPLVAVYD